MNFGLSLSGLLQHSRDGDMVQRFADVLHLVRVARDLGFDYVYAGQHYLSHPFQMLQPLVSLARIGAETGDMDLLSTVLIPLQNPVQMAEGRRHARRAHERAGHRQRRARLPRRGV